MRLTDLSPEKRREAFLDRLRKDPNIAKAARAVGYTRQRMYQMRDEDPAFAEAWNEALLEAIDMAEGEVYRRGVKGTLKPVYQGGAKVGTIREYSDTLLIFLLKAHKPEKYRETSRQELTGPDGGPIQTQGQVIVYIPDNNRDTPAGGAADEVPGESG